MRLTFRNILAACLCASVLIPAGAMAQEVSAGITGAVTDPSGAAVVGASVSARDVSRGTVWPTPDTCPGRFPWT